MGPKGEAERKGWRKLKVDMQDMSMPDMSEIRMPTSDEVHGAMTRLHREAEKDLGMSGIRTDAGGDGAQEGLRTDEDMAREIGDKRMYMPQYVTAIVGHGTKAPGYLAALAAVGAAMFVWREWSHVTSYGSWDDIRTPLATLPVFGGGGSWAAVPVGGAKLTSQLVYLSPLLTCAAMEALVQLWLASVETIAAPITGIYLGFTIDATGVFMMGIGAAGVVGMAAVPALKPRAAMRSLVFGSHALATAGLVVCVPWFGQLTPAMYTGGSYITAVGCYMLSSLAGQIFARGIARGCDDGRDVAWLLFFWRWSSAPVKLVAPVLLAYSLDYESSASVSYLVLLLAAVGVWFALWYQRRILLHQNAGENECEPQIATRAPEAGGLLGGASERGQQGPHGGVGGSPGKAYGSF